jgi:hypothetical protein
MKIVSLSRAGAIAALASTAVAAAPAVIAPIASARVTRTHRSGAPQPGPQGHIMRLRPWRPNLAISIGRPVFGPVAPPRH